MTTPIINAVEKYVEDNIQTFHEHRLARIKKLKLKDILKRKNPYLFRVKNILSAGEIVKGFLDAYASSQEETIFGDWLEGLCIFVSSEVYQGRKSTTEGIDLEFDKDNTRYLVAVKSGPNWGNSSQKKIMVDNFNKAKKSFRTSNSANLNIEFINGCCYGRDSKPYKKEGYYKYCGQKFWEFISDEKELFVKIIEPLGKRAKENNDDFMKAYAQITNLFTAAFMKDYCNPAGGIDWEKLVRFNSEE